MASVARRETANDQPAGTRLVPVIADGGQQAWVVLVEFAAPPRLGDTFTFRGLEWSIVRCQDAVRGCVAHPRPTAVGDH